MFKSAITFYRQLLQYTRMNTRTNSLYIYLPGLCFHHCSDLYYLAPLSNILQDCCFPLCFLIQSGKIKTRSKHSSVIPFLLEARQLLFDLGKINAAFQIWKMSQTKKIIFDSAKSRASVATYVYRTNKSVCLQLYFSIFMQANKLQSCVEAILRILGTNREGLFF